METPLGVSARITSSFALASLKAQASVLDVGSGDGRIAATMVRGGLKVTAIDQNEKAVAATTARGVTCHHTTLLDFAKNSTALFDAALFSRSLHHMMPFDQTLSDAASLLKDDGLLLVEDFGYERVDKKTAVWHSNLARLLVQQQTVKENTEPQRHQWLTSERQYDDGEIALAIWRHHNEVAHNIASFERIKNGLMDRFEIVEEQNVPYLYHYLIDLLPATKDGARLAQLIYNWEKEQAESGGIVMCGARLVARKAK